MNATTGPRGWAPDVGVEPELREHVAERRAVGDVVRVSPVPGVVHDRDLELARPLAREAALRSSLADDPPGLARELDEPLALLVRLAVRARAVVRLAPGVEDVEADRLRAEVERAAVLVQAGLPPARGEGRRLDHRVGRREEHGELGDVVGAVGPVPHYRLAGLVAVQPVRVGLVGVAQDVVTDEEGDRHAHLAAPVEGGAQLLLRAEPVVEDDRVPVLEPPVPEDDLADAERRVGDLRRILGQVAVAEARWRVAYRRPERADGERFAHVPRRVVDVAVLDELPEGLGPGVPVARVRQQDDVVAVPALLRVRARGTAPSGDPAARWPGPAAGPGGPASCSAGCASTG